MADFSTAIVLLYGVCTTNCLIICDLYGTECITPLGPLESKLNQLVRIICGLIKQDSIRSVSKHNQILTVKQLHLNEILKLLVIVLRNESQLEEI